MNNFVEKFINQIKSNTRLNYYDETQTKQAIILPLLQYLGWNVFDVEEVAPEFLVENKRIDFALRINNNNQVFIEVKKPTKI